MDKKTIAVIGATGAQGKGLVNELVSEGSFNARVATGVYTPLVDWIGQNN
jgi:uncharacterized protein YbjT (DUF2867 family)